MNIILSDVSRYKGSKGTWKDVFKYYVTNPSFRVIFLHRLYHQWYHILSKIPMGKGIFSLYYKHICRQSGIQLSLEAEIGEGFKFEHFGGIVIGSIKIGKNCNIFHNVTLGYAGRWRPGGDGPKTLEDLSFCHAANLRERSEASECAHFVFTDPSLCYQ